MDFWTFRNNLKTLTPKKVAEIAIEVVDDDYIKYLINEQLDDGQRPDGTYFEEYSPVTIEIKKKTGGFLSPSGRIALRNYGDFREKIFLKKLKSQINISSKDSKAKDIIKEFGDVFGLTTDNFDLAIEDSEELLIQRLQEILDK